METLKEKKIALIQGGLGAEREVSFSTGKSFEAALKKLNLNYVVINAELDLPQKLIEIKPDLALLALHGKYAEDGVVQGLCEYLKIPYTGSGLLSSALCMSKLYSKQLFQYHEIPTPDFELININFNLKNTKTYIDEVLNKAQSKWGLPLVVKPSREGSSVGVTICKSESDLKPAVELALKYDRQVLVEQFVSGQETTVTVFKGEALTPIEIVPKVNFYNYENKYTQGMTDYYLPARYKNEVNEFCQKISLKAAQALGTRTYCRVDLIVTENDEAYVLEINTLPGATPTSLTPKSCAYHEIPFEEFILELLKEAHLDYEALI